MRVRDRREGDGGVVVHEREHVEARDVRRVEDRLPARGVSCFTIRPPLLDLLHNNLLVASQLLYFTIREARDAERTVRPAMFAAARMACQRERQFTAKQRMIRGDVTVKQLMRRGWPARARGEVTNANTKPEVALPYPPGDSSVFVLACLHATSAVLMPMRSVNGSVFTG